MQSRKAWISPSIRAPIKFKSSFYIKKYQFDNYDSLGHMGCLDCTRGEPWWPRRGVVILKVDDTNVSLTGLSPVGLSTYYQVLKKIENNPRSGRAHNAHSSMSRTQFHLAEVGLWISVTYWMILALDTCKILFAREHPELVSDPTEMSSSIMDSIAEFDRQLATKYAIESINELQGGKMPV